MPTLVNTIRIMNEQTTTDKLNLKGFMVYNIHTKISHCLLSKCCTFVQVGNGCVGNLVGGCGSVTGVKIHVDYFHTHALYPAVSTNGCITLAIIP